jgi:hypothetical protein
MVLQKTPGALGVLRTERGATPGGKPFMLPRGYLLNPETFDFPVIWETVEGGWVDRVFAGDPALEVAAVAAAQRLVERGAVALSASCGFFARYQQAVAASVPVPVVLSSLLLLPLLLRQLPPAKKLAVLTADSKCLTDDLLGVPDPKERARIVIGGVEGGILWRNELQRPPPVTTGAEIEEDVVGCVERMMKTHQDIGAFLFECTVFPMVSQRVRMMTGLPVYDVTTLCRATVSGVTA